MYKEVTLTVEDNDEEYEFVRVTDAEDAYVARDDEIPSRVIDHLEIQTDYRVFAPGDDEVSRTPVRHIDVEQGTSTAYYLNEKPDTAVIDLCNIDASASVLKDVELSLEADGYDVQTIEQAYYYPDHTVEVWFYATTETGHEAYPARRHEDFEEDLSGVTHKTVEETVEDLDDDPVDESASENEDGEKPLVDQVIEEFDPDEHVSDADGAVDESDGGYEVHEPIPDWIEDAVPFGDDDDVDPIEYDEATRESDLHSEGVHSQSIGDDDDDGSSYPDASGRPDNGGDDRE